MKQDLYIKTGYKIPGHELEITATSAGGPGGQHVNKSDTRVIVRWNVVNTTMLYDVQKARIVQKLQSRLTKDGDLIVTNGESRSQKQNKENALLQLAQIVREALYIPKKRIATKEPKAAKETRLRIKSRRSEIKKMRTKKIND